METSPDKSGARQFSLIKLMLWIAVLAVCLGVLRVTVLGPIAAIVLTVCLTVMLIGRQTGGIRGGLIAALSVPVACGYNVLVEKSGNPLLLFVTGCILGICPGVVAFLFVDAVAYFFDWLDTIGRKSRPPDS